MKKATFIDVETTGLDSKDCEVIEVALIQILFNEDKQLKTITLKYNEFQEPNEPIPEFITKLTNISNEDVKGKTIDWNLVQKTLEESDIIVAHNAEFDKKFILKYTNLEKNMPWACSINLIDWKMQYQQTNSKLETLKKSFTIHSGESHRAINDVITLIKILMKQGNNGSFFNELYTNFHSSYKCIVCHGVNFSDKELLKEWGFRWCPPNKSHTNEGFWYKNIPAKGLYLKDIEKKIRTSIKLKSIELMDASK